MPRVSVVVSGDFCRFKLALPSLLSMSKDEVNEVNTTTDTQGMSNFLLILRVKYSYFEIFIVLSPYSPPLLASFWGWGGTGFNSYGQCVFLFFIVNYCKLQLIILDSLIIVSK